MAQGELMSIKAAAQALGVSRGMVYRMIQDGRLKPAVDRPGYRAHRYLIAPEEIDRVRPLLKGGG